MNTELAVCLACARAQLGCRLWYTFCLETMSQSWSRSLRGRSSALSKAGEAWRPWRAAWSLLADVESGREGFGAMGRRGPAVPRTT